MCWSELLLVLLVSVRLMCRVLNAGSPVAFVMILLLCVDYRYVGPFGLLLLPTCMRQLSIMSATSMAHISSVQ